MNVSEDLRFRDESRLDMSAMQEQTKGRSNIGSSPRPLNQFQDQNVYQLNDEIRSYNSRIDLIGNQRNKNEYYQANDYEGG